MVPEIWSAPDVFFLSSWVIFSSFTAWKNENFKKMKKNPGDIIILHKFTKIHDHMLYCSWDMACDRCIVIFHSGLYFSYLQMKKNETAQNMKISKKWKKKGLEISFYANHDHILYCSWDMARETCNCYFSFWAIFCPFTSLPTLPDLEISFYTCVPKIMISWCTVPEIWWATDGWTDGRKRWHIEVTFKKAKGVLV